MAHAFRLGGELHEVWLSRTQRGYELHLGERRISLELRDRGEHARELVLGDRALPVHIAVRGDVVHVYLEGEAHALTYVHSLERFAGEARDQSNAVSRAPMPGAVIAIPVRPGQTVCRGDVLMVIESMKMETAICAALDGEVQTVHLQQGQTFERDAVLVTLNPAPAAA